MKYEAFKKGIFVKNWENEFKKFININDNSFLKIEYINFLLENNLDEKYHIIDKFKFDKHLMNEYFYYYIYGKYYNKINYKNLNFYFCQFYKAISSKNKADFCEKYDIKDIPTLDKSYAYLNKRQILDLANKKQIYSDKTLVDAQIQPASLDLTLSSKCYRIKASFIPNNIKISEVIKELSLTNIDLNQNKLLEKNCIYLCN